MENFSSIKEKILYKELQGYISTHVMSSIDESFSNEDANATATPMDESTATPGAPLPPPYVDDPLLFNRYVPMYREDVVYVPPFFELNPLTITKETVERNDHYQTHLMEMIMFKEEHEEADVGIAEQLRDALGDELQDRTMNDDGNVRDTYQSEDDGNYFYEQDEAMGFVPNKTLFRLGNGTPLAPEDVPDFESLSEPERETKKRRIYDSICSLNSVMHFVYARSKRHAVLIERMSELSLYGKMHKLYQCVADVLGAINTGESSAENDKFKFVIASLKSVANKLRILATHVTRSVIDNDDNSYAFVYDVHRKAFNGYVGMGRHLRSDTVHPKFAALVGQELWLILHYLLPSMNRMHQKTIVATHYEEYAKERDVDAYSYAYGEVFVRDFYRFEIVTHELYLRSIKTHGFGTVEGLYESIAAWATEENLTMVDIAEKLRDQLHISESNMSTLYFWVVNLINATREASRKGSSTDDPNANERRPTPPNRKERRQKKPLGPGKCRRR